MKVTVIICTHNPRHDYLTRTLESVRRQTMPREQWELLLIDNASVEPLSNTVDLSWHPNARHVREGEVGLTAARLTAIQAAKGEWLVFVDDDNVLKADFLSAMEGVPRRHPSLGVFGAGTLEPEFEMEPPPELSPYLQRLALRAVHQARWSDNPADTNCVPWGAGLCVRRDVAQEYVEVIRQLRVTTVLGRRGKQLFCGEDDVFSWVSAQMGLRFGVIPELQITHLISAPRLSRQYFRRLIHDHTFSHGVLNYLLAGRIPRPIRAWRYARLLLHGIRNGVFSMQCQLAQFHGEAAASRFIDDRALRPLPRVTVRRTTR